MTENTFTPASDNADHDNDEQQALRDVIAELVTENATLKNDNSRLRDDNHDLAEQAANYLAQITSATAASTSRFGIFRRNSSSNSSSNFSTGSEGASGDEGSSTTSDPVQQQQQRTIEELQRKVLMLTEEKLELATQIETLEHQLMMTRMTGSCSSSVVESSPSVVTPAEKIRTPTRGFLPGIFFASRSISEDESVPVSSSTSSSSFSVDPKQQSNPRSPITMMQPPTTPPKTSPAEPWSLLRHEDRFEIEGTDTTTRSQGLSAKGTRSSIFSGRFRDIYCEAKEPEKVIIKKPDYFGTIDKQRKMGSHRLSTAAAMVDDDDDEGEKYFRSDSRKTAAATFDLLL
jgi:hypothetical protein